MAFSNVIAARFAAVSAPVQGALLMVGAAFCFAVMTGLIRYGSASLEPIQIAFFRNLFALLFMMPWLLSVGPGALRTERIGLHGVRAIVGILAMVCWFYAVALLPLAQAVSLNFTVPLFATAGAAIILGEVVRARRWSATVVGFLGVLVIVRPGFESLPPAVILPILAAVFMASAALLIKSLSRSENPNAMVFYMNLFLTPLSLIPALFFWRWPSWEILGIMILIGLFAVVGHSLMTRAYARADASAVVPFHYVKLPFIALIGYLAFAEVPDVWTLLGAAIIAGAAIYIARREAIVAGARPLVRPAANSLRERN